MKSYHNECAERRPNWSQPASADAAARLPRLTSTRPPVSGCSSSPLPPPPVGGGNQTPREEDRGGYQGNQDPPLWRVENQTSGKGDRGGLPATRGGLRSRVGGLRPQTSSQTLVRAPLVQPTWCSLKDRISWRGTESGDSKQSTDALKPQNSNQTKTQITKCRDNISARLSIVTNLNLLSPECVMFGWYGACEA